jgi:CubicO group peptidase (beta-lactamase class C family)
MSSQRRPKHLLLLVILLLAPVAVADDGTIVDDASVADRIDGLLSAYHDHDKLNGAALVAADGEVIYSRGFGLANMEWDIPNATDTRFRLGSITKQFTAAVILQLVEEGRLSVEDPVTKHLPDYPAEPGDRITIHHLLTHTSGIPSYTGLPGFMEDHSRDPYTPEAFVEVFSGLELEFEPGSQWRYNNSGYFLLGVIIEKIEGKPYEDVLAERIFGPLGMADSGYDRSERITPRRAAGYERRGLGYRNARYLDMSLPYAAGSLYSTVEDLYRWDRALYGEQLLPAAHRDLLWTPHEAVGDDAAYGYGFMLRSMPIGSSGRTVATVQHGGGINGFNTLLLRIPADEHLVVLLSNTGRANLSAMAFGLVQILYGEEAEMPRQDISRVVLEVIEREGVSAAIAHYRQLKDHRADAYAFAEPELNAVGYELLGRGDVDGAIAVLALNVEMYPEAFNTYDSLGEAYMSKGENDLAIANYRRSLELNPRNEGAKAMLAKLGIELDDSLGKTVSLAPELLERYVGAYELRPGLVMTVTLEDGRLMAELTGQRTHPISPISETQFIVEGVDAQLTFAVDGDGRAESVTLNQGERTIKGMRQDS